MERLYKTYEDIKNMSGGKLDELTMRAFYNAYISGARDGILLGGSTDPSSIDQINEIFNYNYEFNVEGVRD